MKLTAACPSVSVTMPLYVVHTVPSTLLSWTRKFCTTRPHSVRVVFWSSVHICACAGASMMGTAPAVRLVESVDSVAAGAEDEATAELDVDGSTGVAVDEGVTTGAAVEVSTDGAADEASDEGAAVEVASADEVWTVGTSDGADVTVVVDTAGVADGETASSLARDELLGAAVGDCTSEVVAASWVGSEANVLQMAGPPP